MSRDDGFARADVDTSYFEDGKMRDLWQRLRDPDRMAKAVCVHASTLLASWRQGERVTAAQACPLWLLVDDDSLSALRAVRLLDKTDRIPAASWAVWFGEAQQRRGIRSVSGRIGGIASGEARRKRSAKHARNVRTDAEAVVPEHEANTNPASQPAIPAIPASQPASPGGSAASADPDRDPADDYWTVTGKYPNDKARKWIDDLAYEYGASAVTRAMASCHQSDPSTATLLSRVKDSLARSARKLEMAEAGRERERLASHRAAGPRRPMSTEEELAERRAILAEVGKLTGRAAS